MTVNQVLPALLQAIAARQPTSATPDNLNNSVGANVTLSGGNLTYTSTVATTACSARSGHGLTIGSTGKVYFEITAVSAGDAFIGFGESSFVDSAAPGVPGWYTNSYGWRQSGALYYNASSTSSPSAGWVANDVLQVAIDFSAKLAWFNDLTHAGSTGWNNGSGNPGTGAGGISISSVTGKLNIIVANYNSTGKYTFNLGATAFSGSLPSGFSSWNALAA